MVINKVVLLILNGFECIAVVFVVVSWCGGNVTGWLQFHFIDEDMV